MDFIVWVQSKTVSRPDKIIAIEVKHSKRWDKKYTKYLADFREALGEKRVERTIGVYLGDKEISETAVEVFPVQTFLEKLFAGEFF